MPVPSTPNNRLSLSDTNVLKGLALLFLLIHHLFYVQNGLYDDIQLTKSHAIVHDFGVWCKMCVAIFVFLSGYGLMVKAKKENGVGSILHFYWHRFVKLLMNYWFIWLIFVPIGVFVFGRTFTDVYGNAIFPRLILDFFGLLNCFGWYGYNPTWWFYSCIIVLYLSFPFLYQILEKSPLLLIPVVVVIYFIPIHAMDGGKAYFASFAAGMAFCKYYKQIEGINQIWCFALFLFFACVRFFLSNLYLLDAIIALMLVICYKFINIPSAISKSFCFLGKHSMNIFLFHTFIFLYWFQEYIYMTRNPLNIFISLLGSCVLISVFLELIKKTIHFDSLIKKVESLYVR